MTDLQLLADVRQALADAGLVQAGDEAAIVPLGGGVSNDVLAVTVGERRYVVKRALEKLRVRDDWRSDIRRIHREAACQRWLEAVLRPGEVPAVRWEDQERHLYVMDHAPDGCLNWKDELLAGRVPAEAAARAGDMLGRIHSAGRAETSLREAFGDKRVFDELRLDPYLRTIAQRHPDIAEQALAEAERLAAADETVVHGDYSPKNMLLLPDRNLLLDHEVVHWGDPRFDLAFLFTHLFLKAIHVAAAADELWAQVPRAWTAYQAAYPRVAEGEWLRLLGCVLLARVDGKSPAGYLTGDEETRVRGLAKRLIRDEAETLADALELGRQT